MNITKEEAIDVAFKKAQVTKEDAYGTHAKLEKDDGISVYEVEFKANGYEYEIVVNAETGEIVEFDREQQENNKPIDSAVTITKENAIEIALNKAEVTKDTAYGVHAKLEKDDGAMIYEVEFKTDDFEFEVDINAVSGEVIKFDRENN